MKQLGSRIGTGISWTGKTNSRTCPSDALKVCPVGAVNARGAKGGPDRAGVLARLAGNACAFPRRRDSAGILARRADRARLRVVVRVVTGQARGGLDRQAALVLYEQLQIGWQARQGEAACGHVRPGARDVDAGLHLQGLADPWHAE